LAALPSPAERVHARIVTACGRNLGAFFVDF
jgi:hypothetical protein